jgi:hypothetical protein
VHYVQNCTGRYVGCIIVLLRTLNFSHSYELFAPSSVPPWATLCRASLSPAPSSLESRRDNNDPIYHRRDVNVPKRPFFCCCPAVRTLIHTIFHNGSSGAPAGHTSTNNISKTKQKLPHASCLFRCRRLWTFILL